MGVIPYVDDSVLSEFSYKAINFRPEPPWIEHYENGIKFTEEIKTTIDFVESDIEEPKPLYLNQNLFIEISRFEKTKREYKVKLKANSYQSMALTLDCKEAEV